MAVKIGILNIGIGNLRSVWNGVHAVGFDPVFVSRPDQIKSISHLIFPGVSAYGEVSQQLDLKEIKFALRTFAADGNFLLGLCAGMQILSDEGYENGVHSGLGLIPGRVEALSSDSSGNRIQHVGWNDVTFLSRNPILNKINSEVDFYFCHSYHFVCINKVHMLGETNYSRPFTSMVANENVIGVQFHPEKSQRNGLQMIENFCRL